MKNIVIGIDVGGTSTKIVGFEHTANAKNIIKPQLVQATDPLTSIYGAFGKFLNENDLTLNDIQKIYVTGAGAGVLKNGEIYNQEIESVSEFQCSGRGGLYLSGLDEAIVVSMGTGTAIIHAKKENNATAIDYLGGTGVGGGTLQGLGKHMIGIDSLEHFDQLCEKGDLDKIDLKIKDISKAHNYSGINEDITAANFGKISDLATPSDYALGIVNMIAESIATLAIFATKIYKVKDIVLIGNLSTVKAIQEVFYRIEKDFNVHFIIPELSRFGTVIGSALTFNGEN